jgi:hypothetical protein
MVCVLIFYAATASKTKHVHVIGANRQPCVLHSFPRYMVSQNKLRLAVNARDHSPIGILLYSRVVFNPRWSLRSNLTDY